MKYYKDMVRRKKLDNILRIIRSAAICVAVRKWVVKGVGRCPMSVCL